jgi:hypothetical protein
VSGNDAPVIATQPGAIWLRGEERLEDDPAALGDAWTAIGGANLDMAATPGVLPIGP